MTETEMRRLDKIYGKGMQQHITKLKTTIDGDIVCDLFKFTTIELKAEAISIINVKICSKVKDAYYKGLQIKLDCSNLQKMIDFMKENCIELYMLLLKFSIRSYLAIKYDEILFVEKNNIDMCEYLDNKRNITIGRMY